MDAANEAYEERLEARREQRRAEEAAVRRDAERLDWLISHSAQVCHANDAEFCWVKWFSDQAEEPMNTPMFDDGREAIDAAIELEENA